MSGTANAAAFGAVQSPSISPPANVVDDLIQAVAQRACDAANSTLQPLHSASAISEIALGPRIANPISETSIKVADRPSLFRRATRRTLRFAFVLFLGVALTLAWQSYGETAKHMVVTWAPQLGPWIPFHESSGPSIQLPAAEVRAMPVQEASSEEATAVPDAVRQSAALTPTSSEADLQQLEEIARDVSAARQSIERLAAAQAEMASAIAKLQAAQLQTDQKLAAPAPRPNAARVAKPAAPAVPRISSQNQPPFQGVLDPVH
jgi:hypothetical protein